MNGDAGRDDGGALPDGLPDGLPDELPSALPALSPELERQFSTLVREHQLHLYRFILRNIGSSPDAEDIAQQAFVEAYRAMASFRGESKLSTWLYGIAMNLVRNYLNRAPHRVRMFESEDVLETLPDQADGPEARVLRNQVLEQLAGTVADLPPDLQQIFLLVAIDGLSYDQAASLLELPVGTVRSRLFRARATLQERLPDLRGALEP